MNMRFSSKLNPYSKNKEAFHQAVIQTKSELLWMMRIEIQKMINESLIGFDIHLMFTVPSYEEYRKVFQEFKAGYTGTWGSYIVLSGTVFPKYGQEENP